MPNLKTNNEQSEWNSHFKSCLMQLNGSSHNFYIKGSMSMIQLLILLVNPFTNKTSTATAKSLPNPFFLILKTFKKLLQPISILLVLSLAQFSRCLFWIFVWCFEHKNIFNIFPSPFLSSECTLSITIIIVSIYILTYTSIILQLSLHHHPTLCRPLIPLISDRGWGVV